MTRKLHGIVPLALAAAALALGGAFAIPAHAAGIGGPYGTANIQIPFTNSPSRAGRPDAFMPRTAGAKNGMNWQKKGEAAMEG